MPAKKIPLINEHFDLGIFLFITKRSLWIVVLLISFSAFLAYIYIRYTSPTFESKSIIQVAGENKTNQLLQIESVYDNVEMAQVLEILKSKEFLKRTFDKLPMEISYFWQGTFLSEELYRQTPYTVTAKISDPAIYDTKIFINFVDKNKFELKIN